MRRYIFRTTSEHPQPLCNLSIFIQWTRSKGGKVFLVFPRNIQLNNFANRMNTQLWTRFSTCEYTEHCLLTRVLQRKQSQFCLNRFIFDTVMNETDIFRTDRTVAVLVSHRSGNLLTRLAQFPLHKSYNQRTSRQFFRSQLRIEMPLVSTTEINWNQLLKTEPFPFASFDNSNSRIMNK